MAKNEKPPRTTPGVFSNAAQVYLTLAIIGLIAATVAAGLKWLLSW